MANNFLQILNNAAEASRNDNSLLGFYGKVIEKLNGTSTVPSNIELSCEFQHTSGDIIESAIRKLFGDKRSDRKTKTDLVHLGRDVEIKYNRKGFSALSIDSQGIVKKENKWYLYVTGEINTKESNVDGTLVPSIFEAWLMHSSHLFNELFKFNEDKGHIEVDENGIGKLKDSISIHKDDEEASINEIAELISAQAKGFATAIFEKAAGLEERQKQRMTLSKNVGMNRVRFDVKFSAYTPNKPNKPKPLSLKDEKELAEQLIRLYVRDIISG